MDRARSCFFLYDSVFLRGGCFVAVVFFFETTDRRRLCIAFCSFVCIGHDLVWNMNFTAESLFLY
jgi:hypothetical protein